VLEAGATVMTEEPNFLSAAGRTRWDVPSLNLVYSPSDNVEIDLAWAGRVIAVEDPAFGTVSDWGDVVLRTKVRLARSAKRDFALAARFMVALPETNQAKGLGPNTLRVGAQLLATKTFARGAVHANLGLSIHDEVLTPHAQNDLLSYGVAAERQLSPRWALVAEVAGRAGSGEPVIDRTHEARLGVRRAGQRLGFAAALRRGLSDADGTWGFTGGVILTLRSAHPLPPDSTDPAPRSTAPASAPAP
jgi:hypothetical protein